MRAKASSSTPRSNSSDRVSITDPAAFILANTRLQVVPHAPEISLWLADEITPIWKLTEEELGELGLPPPFWAFAWSGGQGLARWVLDNPLTFAGKTVVDFATGSGLVGVAAMKAGAATGSRLTRRRSVLHCSTLA